MSVSKRKVTFIFVAMIITLTACSMPSFGGPAPTVSPARMLLTPVAPTAVDISPVQPTSTPFIPTPTPTFAPTVQVDLEPAAVQMADHPLANTSWVLRSFAVTGSETEAVNGGNAPSIMFGADGNANGQGGCNVFAGSYQVQGNTLSFGPLALTRMACADQTLSAQEQSYIDALGSANSFQIFGDKLIIAYNGGQAALNFERESPGASEGLCTISLAYADREWLCRNEADGFAVQYPLAGSLREQSADSARIDLPHAPGTNLSEKYLDINTAQGGDTCASPVAAGYAPGSLPSEPVVLNGIEFTRQTGQDSGAGSRYEWTAYTTQRAGLCVSLTFVLHSIQADVEPPLPTFDMAAESSSFEGIAATFRWLEGGAVEQAAPPPARLPDTSGAERIRFDTGEISASVNGRLGASESQVYVLRALKGQTMTVELSFERGDATLMVWGANGSVLLHESAGASRFEGVLPANQDYYIQVQGRSGGSTQYRMRVRIPALTASSSSEPTTERIRFARGATSGRVSDHLSASGSRIYVLRALRGQTMTVTLTFSRGDAILAVWGANGVVLMSSASESSRFEGYLPYTQDYFIQVIGRDSGGTDFHMKVSIPPL